MNIPNMNTGRHCDFVVSLKLPQHPGLILWQKDQCGKLEPERHLVGVRRTWTKYLLDQYSIPTHHRRFRLVCLGAKDKTDCVGYSQLNLTCWHDHLTECSYWCLETLFNNNKSTLFESRIRDAAVSATVVAPCHRKKPSLYVAFKLIHVSIAVHQLTVSHNKQSPWAEAKIVYKDQPCLQNCCLIHKQALYTSSRRTALDIFFVSLSY